jgi:hypothetical protein
VCAPTMAELIGTIHDDLASWRVRACRVHAGCAAIRGDMWVISLSRKTELLNLPNLPTRRTGIKLLDDEPRAR